MGGEICSHIQHRTSKKILDTCTRYCTYHINSFLHHCKKNIVMNILLIVICSLTLSFGAAVGINIQKMSMMNEEKKDGCCQRPPILQPLWCLGMTIIMLDAIGDFVFIGLAPQSLLAPLGSFSLGWNIILAPKFNPTEVVTRNIVVATGVIYAGTILTVLYASDTSPTYDLANIVELLVKRPFHIYFLACLTFLITLAYNGQTKGYKMVHYCGLAGCLGGFCILFAKATSELVENSIATGNVDAFTTSFLPYIFIVCMVITVVTQIRCLNTGLAKFDALIVVPVYQSFWNVFGITGGLVFFQEYQYMTATDGVLYTLGLCITFKGVAMLVNERSNSLQNAVLHEGDSLGSAKCYDSVDHRNMDETVDTIEEGELDGLV